MDIGHAHALGKAGEAADLNVFANYQYHLLLLLGDGQIRAVVLAVHERVQVRGGLSSHSGSHALDEVHKFLVLAYKVGLGVDLNHHAHAVNNASVGHALGGNAASLLGGSGQALLTQVLNRLVHVAVRGGQSLLAVHHAHAGHLAQVFYISSCKSHIYFLHINILKVTEK